MNSSKQLALRQMQPGQDFRHTEMYYRYISDRRPESLWSRRKQRWYRLHGRWCRGCGTLDPPTRRQWMFWIRKNWLHLHHLSYVAMSKNPGFEPDEDLSCLCRFCHERTHAMHRSGRFGHDEASLRRATIWLTDRYERKRARRKEAPSM